MDTKILTLDVTITEPRSYGGPEVVNVHIGRCLVGSLYRDPSEANWYVYGYLVKPDALGRKGDLRDILGEDSSCLEMAKRLLAYNGYIPSTLELYVRDSGLVHDDLHHAIKLEAQSAS